MFTWIIDRYEVLREALTLQRVFAISLMFAAATAVATLSSQIAQWISGEGAMLLGVPSWAWGLLASLALTGWFLLEYALRLKREVTPRVRASFDAEKAGITLAIERPVNPGALSPHGFRATYIRFRVETLSKKAVRDCTAHIIGIWKRPSDGPQTEIDLPHVVQLERQFDVLPYAHRMIDFLRCAETDNKLVPTVPWPFHLEHAFRDPATYRFKFAIQAEGVSEILTVDVYWAGAWNTIKAEQVAETPPS